MKKFAFIFLLSLVFISCSKDENWISEYDLFDRLQYGSGVWQVESYESFNVDDPSPSKTITTPQNEYYEFYIATKEVIGGNIVQINSANHFVNDSVIQLTCEAEKERVVFNPSLAAGEVWTVTENKRNKQTWVFVSGSNATIMVLKRCNCNLPNRNTTENEG